jgi:hypothetical protein
MESVELRLRVDDLRVDFTPVSRAAVDRLNGLLDALRAGVYTATEIAPMIMDIMADLPEEGDCGCPT